MNYKKKFELLEDLIYNKTTSFCMKHCNHLDSCDDEECVIYKIEKILEDISRAK